MSTSEELSALLLISSGVGESITPRVIAASVGNGGENMESVRESEVGASDSSSLVIALRTELAEALSQRTALMFQNKELMQIVEDQDARLGTFEAELENHSRRFEEKEMLLKSATEAARIADTANVHLSAQLSQQSSLMKEARLEAEERAFQNQELKSALGTIEARLGSEIAQITEALRMRKEAHYTALERASTAEETRRQAIDDAHRLQVALQGAHARLVEMEARHHDDEKRVSESNDAVKMHAQESAGLREAVRVLQARHSSADGERIRLASELSSCLQQLRKATDTLLALLDRVKLAETAKSRAMDSLRSREAEVVDLLSQIETMKRTQVSLEQQSHAAREDAELYKAHVATLAAKIRDEAQRAAKDDVGKRETQEQNRVLAARAALLAGHLQASEESSAAERARAKRLETELSAATSLCGDLRSKLDQNDRLESEHRLLEKSHEELYDKANELQKDLEYAVQKLKDQEERLLMASSSSSASNSSAKINNNNASIEGHGEEGENGEDDDYESIINAPLGQTSSTTGESLTNNNSNLSSSHLLHNSSSSSSSSFFVPELKVGVGLLLVKGEKKEARKLLTRLNLNDKIKRAQMLKPNMVRNGFVRIVCSLLNLLNSEIEKRNESEDQLKVLFSKAESAMIINQQYAERIANNDETKRRLIVKLARTMMERALSHATLVNSRSHLSISDSELLRGSDSSVSNRTASSSSSSPSSILSSLTSLSLDDASIGDEGVAVLLSSLKNAIQGAMSSSSSSLTALQNVFKQNNLSDLHSHSMDRSLMISIQDLSLRNNSITDEGALAIASFLSKGFTGFFEESSSTSLQDSSPSKKRYDEESKGGDVTSDALLLNSVNSDIDSTQPKSQPHSPTVMFIRIHSINLSGNYITRAGIKALAEAAEASSLVQHVFVHASGRIEALGTRSVSAINNTKTNNTGAISSLEASSSPPASALITVESVIDCSDQMPIAFVAHNPFNQQQHSSSSSPLSSMMGLNSLSNVNSSIMSEGGASSKTGNASLKQTKQRVTSRPSTTSHPSSSSSSSSSSIIAKNASAKGDKEKGGATSSRVMTSPSSTFSAQQAALSFTTARSPFTATIVGADILGIDSSSSYTSNSIRGGGSGSAALTQLIDDEERERSALLSSSTKKVQAHKINASALHSSIRDADIPSSSSSSSSSSRVLAEQTREALWMGRAGGLDVVPLTLQESVGPSVLLQRGSGGGGGGGVVQRSTTLSSSASNTSSRLNHLHPNLASTKVSSSSSSEKGQGARGGGDDEWASTEGLSASSDIDANRAALDIAGRLLFSVNSIPPSSSGGTVNVKAMVNKSGGGGAKLRATSAKAINSRSSNVSEEEEAGIASTSKNEEGQIVALSGGRSSTLEEGNSVSSWESKTYDQTAKSASGSGVAAARNRYS